MFKHQPSALSFLQKRFLKLRVFSEYPDFPFFLNLAPLSRTGKMPIPQEMNFLVEQASCLFLNK
ncbi:hypothetical protein AVDCRST_MAG84-4615 [uncultured Microcoleus sp.]|uniref:Uncharacterized protein n=1 Tax=uncultured Microcoleus sp. TaxID=259945 RepID=A0A6J4N4C6_9CYAN|nr:hypothetical protein AVDCRST_MAG84-4615 [uncultured Microcoleus sp.]